VKRTSFTVRTATLVCTLMLGSINGAAAATDRVKIGVGPIYPTYAIFAAAKELGYYAAQNLDVDVQTFRGRAAAQDALAAGTVDLCSVVPIEAMRAIEKGVKEHIVAMYAPARAAGWYVMVPAASPITTVAELNGKSIGVTRIGSLSDLWVQRAATLARITLTSVPLDAGVEAGLIAKRVDAAVIRPPASYKGLLGGDLRALVDLEAVLPPTISEGIAASGEMIDRRPDVLRRWLSATSKAVRYMQDNEGWTEAFLKRYFNDNDDQTIGMVYRNVIMRLNTSGAMHPDWIQTSLALGAPPVAPGGAAKLPLSGTVFSTAFTSK
jgi:NitT/TauT family transport system substrate-binding protein